MEAPNPLRIESAWGARALLAVLLGLSALGLWQVQRRPLVDRAGRGNDPALYRAIVQDMRTGASYYQAVGVRMRASGYALSSPFNYRLPTLACFLAAFPSDHYARGLLILLSLVTLVAWLLALRPYARRAPTFVALVALAGLLAWSCLGQAFSMHETWAGVAIALSLALFALGFGVAGMAVALGALVVRELALPHLLVCLYFAFRSGKRQEIYVGAVGLLAFVVGYLAHVHLIRQSMLVAFSAQLPWLSLGGWRFVMKTALANLWLLAGPGWLAALAFPLALVGLFAFPGPLGVRVRATVFLYVATFLLVGLSYNYLWGLIYVGPALAGIAFAPATLARACRHAFPGVAAFAPSPGRGC